MRICACSRYEVFSLLPRAPSSKAWAGVTADLFRSADLFRGNKYASGFVPVFRILSGFVPGYICASLRMRNKWPARAAR